MASNLGSFIFIFLKKRARPLWFVPLIGIISKFLLPSTVLSKKLASDRSVNWFEQVCECA